MKLIPKVNLDLLKQTLFLNGFSLLKLPLLAFITPEVVEQSENVSIVKVRLGYRTRNHLNVMYFGGLAMGAELSIAFRTVQVIQKSGQRIDFLFKSFSADFLKRADGDVHFVCDHAGLVNELVEKAKTSGERMEQEFEGYAIVPSKSMTEPIMRYKLVLTVKNRSFKN